MRNPLIGITSPSSWEAAAAALGVVTCGACGTQGPKEPRDQGTKGPRDQGTEEETDERLAIPHSEFRIPNSTTIRNPQSPTDSPHRQDVGLKERYRRGVDSWAAFDARRPDLLLDNDAAALLFVDDPTGTCDFQPLHERLGIPLVSHFQAPVCEALAAMPWAQLWGCLQSRTWIKACADADLAAELQAFGVPHAIHVAAAAPEADYPRDPLPQTPEGGVIGCLHVSHGSFFNAPHRVQTDLLVPGIAAGFNGRSERGFQSTYFDRYGFDAQPDSMADTAETARSAQRYFAAKGYYTAAIGLNHHARFVRFLRNRLGDGVRLFSDAPLDAIHETFARRRVAQFRSVAINLGLNFNRAERGPDWRLFEIAAAGGFLLAHVSTHVGDFLRPGVECDIFRQETDLLSKIQFYLDHPRHRIEIAAAGQARALGGHLMRHRLSTMLDYVSKCGMGNSECGIPEMRNSEFGIRNEEKRPTFPLPFRIPHSAFRISTKRLLVFQNPGRMSRYWMEGIERGANQLGIETRVIELGEVWPLRQREGGDAQITALIADLVRNERIAAAIGYTCNGCLDLPTAPDDDGRPVALLERLGVRQLMFWSDHPHWAHEQMGLRGDVQPLLRSANVYHFVKSTAAADEIRDILGWPNVYGLPVGEDVDRLAPDTAVAPEFDVVTIVGSPPSMAEELEPFLDHDDPDVDAMGAIVARRAKACLDTLWRTVAPAAIRPALEELGNAWVTARRRDPLTTTHRHFCVLGRPHPRAADWLRTHYLTYFKAVHALWEFGRWPRTFIIRYLTRYFSVGVFGRDWSSVGAGGDGQWVDGPDQPAVYSRGRVALAVSQCGDEEGCAHKPFEITAAGCPCVHVRRKGIEDCFLPGVEIELFDTPRQARDLIRDLLCDEPRRLALARDGRLRTVSEHRWCHRLARMLQLAGLDEFGMRNSECGIGAPSSFVLDPETPGPPDPGNLGTQHLALST